MDRDIGTLEYDETFDPAAAEAQLALVRACEQPPLRPDLQITPGTTQCLMLAFGTWLGARRPRPRRLPLGRADFHSELAAFLRTHPWWLATVSLAPTAEGGYRVRHLVASFTIEAQPHAPQQVQRKLYDAWQAELRNLSAAAPPSARHAVAANLRGSWVTMAVAELLLSAVTTVIGTGLGGNRKRGLLCPKEPSTSRSPDDPFTRAF